MVFFLSLSLPLTTLDPDYYQAEIQDMITAENEPEEHNFEGRSREPLLTIY